MLIHRPPFIHRPYRGRAPRPRTNIPAERTSISAARSPNPNQGLFGKTSSDTTSNDADRRTLLSSIKQTLETGKARIETMRSRTETGVCRYRLTSSLAQLEGIEFRLHHQPNTLCRKTLHKVQAVVSEAERFFRQYGRQEDPRTVAQGRLIPFSNTAAAKVAHDQFEDDATVPEPEVASPVRSPTRGTDPRADDFQVALDHELGLTK